MLRSTRKKWLKKKPGNDKQFERVLIAVKHGRLAQSVTVCYILFKVLSAHMFQG